MNESHSVVQHHTDHKAVKTYILGYVLSALVTGMAFFLVAAYVDSRGLLMSRATLIGILMTLAIEQLAVQVVCFLHLDKESRPRWRLIAFIFASLLVLAVVVGSLWIMYNLNYNMMSPSDVDAYMIDQ